MGIEATAFAQFHFALLCYITIVPFGTFRRILNSVYMLLAFYVYVFAHC